MSEFSEATQQMWSHVVPSAVDGTPTKEADRRASVSVPPPGTPAAEAAASIEGEVAEAARQIDTEEAAEKARLDAEMAVAAAKAKEEAEAAAAAEKYRKTPHAILYNLR